MYDSYFPVTRFHVFKASARLASGKAASSLTARAASAMVCAVKAVPCQPIASSKSR